MRSMKGGRKAMNSIKANVINELEKIFLRKRAVIFMLAVALMGFLSVFFISTIRAKLVFIAMDSVSFPLLVLGVITNIFLPLYIFMLSAEVFSGEIADRSIKLTLLRPISRFKIYVSKNIAIIIYILINLLVMLIATILSSLFLKTSFANMHLTQVIFSYIIDVIPAAVLAIFASLIAQFFKSSNGAIITMLCLYFLIRVISLLVSRFNNMMFTTYLNWSSMWFSSGATLLRGFNTLLMLLAYGIIFLTLGFYFFDKKEV